VPSDASAGPLRATFAVAVDPGNDRVLATGQYHSEITFGSASIIPSVAVNQGFAVALETTGTAAWHQALGSAGSLDAVGRGVAFGASGVAFVTGTFMGKLDIINKSAATQQDVFLERLDSKQGGSVVWATSFAPASPGTTTSVEAIAVSGAHVIVAGTSTGPLGFGACNKNPSAFDGYVASFSDANGTAEWCTQLHVVSGSKAAPAGLAIGPNGSVFVAGTLDGGVDFGDGVTKMGAGGKDVFILKLDANGKPLWSQIAGDGDDQSAAGVAVGPDKDVVVAG